MRVSDPVSCLRSIHVIERKLNRDEYVWSWTYPYLAKESRQAYNRLLRLLQPIIPFSYFHYENEWVYVSSHSNTTEHVGIVLCSAEFNPPRYERLNEILLEYYLQSHCPQSLLDPWISVLTKGKCQTVNEEMYHFGEYAGIDHFQHPQLSQIIKAFGMDVILIYNAILLKKRIFVYHHNVSSLYQFMLSLPAFVAHRGTDTWKHIYPFLAASEEELSQFKNSKCHVIGFSEVHVMSRVDLYDVFINVPAAEVTLSTQGRDTMSMTKTHKEIALFMTQLTEKGSLTERDLLQEISRKTKELLETLRSLSVDEGNGSLKFSIEILKDKDLSPPFQNFLIAFAEAESFHLMK